MPLNKSNVLSFRNSIFSPLSVLAIIALTTPGCVLLEKGKTDSTASTKWVQNATQLSMITVDVPSSATEKITLSESAAAYALNSKDTYVCYVDPASGRSVNTHPISYGAVLQAALEGEFGPAAQANIAAAEEIFLAATRSIIDDVAEIAARDNGDAAKAEPLEVLRALWKASPAREAFMQTALVQAVKAKGEADKALAQSKINDVKKLLTWNPVRLTKGLVNYGKQEFKSTFGSENSSEQIDAQTASDAQALAEATTNEAKNFEIAAEAFADSVIEIVRDRIIPTAKSVNKNVIVPASQAVGQATAASRAQLVTDLSQAGKTIGQTGQEGLGALGAFIRTKMEKETWTRELAEAGDLLARGTQRSVKNGLASATGTTDPDLQREVLIKKAIKAALQLAIVSVKVVDRAVEDAPVAASVAKKVATQIKADSKVTWNGVRDFGSFFKNLVTNNQEDFQEKETAEEVASIGEGSVALFDSQEERVQIATDLVRELFTENRVAASNMAIALGSRFSDLDQSDFAEPQSSNDGATASDSANGSEDFNKFKEFIRRYRVGSHINGKNDTKCADTPEVEALTKPENDEVAAPEAAK
jgi:hypothetical protein